MATVAHEHLQYKIVADAFPTYKEKRSVHLTTENSYIIALGENLRRKVIIQFVCTRKK